uniref:Uncharacterized protein n=1 Tax=Peronospora matthiolae TaxID=2874970 RepID=A0AAV1UH10_9STRA
MLLRLASGLEAQAAATLHELARGGDALGHVDFSCEAGRAHVHGVGLDLSAADAACTGSREG